MRRKPHVERDLRFAGGAMGGSGNWHRAAMNRWYPVASSVAISVKASSASRS
jgi:hypothetical protein